MFNKEEIYMRIGIIVLSSYDGDFSIAVVSEDIFNWVCSTDMSGRKDQQTRWRDTTTPQEIRDNYAKENKNFPDSDPPEDWKINVCLATFYNDKALAAASFGNLKTFYNISDLISWIKNNDVEIIDEYQGVVY
jgi:hypothetical protein